MGQRNEAQPAVLIATLGTEPQVVTAALDLLLRQNERIEGVIVLHTVAPGTLIAEAGERLRQAFDQPPYIGKISLVMMPLTSEQGTPLSDVETLADSKAAFQMMYQKVHHVKQSGKKVHISIAGGRKTLAVFGMAVAQLLFDEEDRIWHLYSAGEYLSSKRLHPQAGDDVHLIPIPIILWSRISPVYTGLGRIEDPFEATERIHQMQLTEKIDQCRSFVLGVLTPAERRVVSRLVRDGLGDNEIAEQLSLSPRTVEQHLRSAYQKAAAHWELENVNRAQLVALLNIYFVTTKDD